MHDYITGIQQIGIGVEKLRESNLFYKNIFPELLQLKGDTGARKIIQQHPDEVATVQFLKGNIDIDTTEDYENLLL